MDATVLHNDSTLAGALVNTQARVPALDGVRGMAIVLVLSFHWIFAASPGWPSADLTISEAVIRRLTMLNWAGVDLFFVLSGFVIGAIILDNRDAGNFLRLPSPLHTRCRRDASRRRFHIIKTLRPQHHGGYTRPLRRTWMTSYLRPRRQVPIKGLGNTWSLAVEEQFYFLAPALLLIVPRRFTAHVLLIGIVLAPPRIAYSSRRRAGAMPPIRCCLAAWMHCWSASSPRGVSATVSPRFRSNARSAWCASPAWLMLIGLASCIIRAGAPAIYPMIIVGFTGIAILGGCFILIASYAPPAFLFNAVLRRFGTYAYCLYLVHQPLGILMHWAILGRAQSIVDLPRDCRHALEPRAPSCGRCVIMAFLRGPVGQHWPRDAI